jgi:hypothetical protein
MLNTPLPAIILRRELKPIVVDQPDLSFAVTHSVSSHFLVPDTVKIAWRSSGLRSESVPGEAPRLRKVFPCGMEGPGGRPAGRARHQPLADVL